MSYDWSAWVLVVGGTHMLGYTRMNHPNGLVFHKKSLDMGPIFVKKSLKEDAILQKSYFF